MSYLPIILITIALIASGLIAVFLYKCHKESKRIAHVAGLLNTENDILNRVFSAKTQEQADSAWIDMEILQTELEPHLKKNDSL